jgi:hypothetical protein
MSRSKTLGVILMLAALPGLAPAYDFPMFDDGVRDCYGRAMIGYDSVINARLGIPPEHALALARLPDVASTAGAEYRDDILIVMWGAYLWTNSPHNYAINVFYRCARDQDRATQAEFAG